MTEANTQSLRRAAMVGIVGAAATAIGGLLVQGIVQPATAVPDERWSYPWSSNALVPVSILWACLHVLVFIGVLGFARSRVAGPSRGARVGVVLALTGTVLLFIGELASIPVRDEHVHDSGAEMVGAVFGVAILLTAGGFLAAGIATLRARLWQGWRRYTPLIVGIWTTALLVLDMTKALPTAVAIYGLCLLALGIALYVQPTPDPAETPPLIVQEQTA